MHTQAKNPRQQESSRTSYLKRALGLALAALLLAATTAPQKAQAQIFDDHIYTMVLFDQLEYAPGPSERPISLEATSWVGGDLNRLWLRAEGEQSTVNGFSGEGEVELEALYGRLITPFFDAVGGARVDTRWGEDPATRGFLAVGVQGIAPYSFEVEPTLYVSHEGDVSAELTAAYGFLFTQRLVLEPELELSAAVQSVPEWGVGSGVNDLGLGLRLRYEISRKFAPYVGYQQNWVFGETADLAGGDASNGAFVFGVRLWR
jgi:copper resistance protein B